MGPIHKNHETAHLQGPSPLFSPLKRPIHEQKAPFYDKSKKSKKLKTSFMAILRSREVLSVKPPPPGETREVRCSVRSGQSGWSVPVGRSIRTVRLCSVDVRRTRIGHFCPVRSGPVCSFVYVLFSPVRSVRFGSVLFLVMADRGRSEGQA